MTELRLELGAILLGVGALIFVFGVLAPNPNTTRNESSARQTYEETKRVGAHQITPYRYEKKEKIFREEWRAERDLQAQQSVAQSTYWMMWATIFGVLLLCGTLYETNRTAGLAFEAAKESRRQAEAAEKQLHLELSERQARITVKDAYLEISTDQTFRRGSLDNRFSLTVGLENVGRLIARKLVIISGLRFHNPRTDVEYFKNTETFEYVYLNPGEVGQVEISGEFDIEPLAQLSHEINPRDIEITLVLSLAWNGELSNERLRADRIFEGTFADRALRENRLDHGQV